MSYELEFVYEGKIGVAGKQWAVPPLEQVVRIAYAYRRRVVAVKTQINQQINQLTIIETPLHCTVAKSRPKSQNVDVRLL